MNELHKAAEMALETLCVGANDAVPNDIDERFEQAIQALRQALAEPELKHRTGDCLITGICAAERHKIYTAPPKREWVGLTDEDYDELLNGDWGGSLIQAVEAKLKEKNGG